MGPPLFWAVQVLHDAPFALGLLLVPATFAAFLAGAWGKHGLPIVMSGMFAMIFSMAVPQPTGGGDAGVVDIALHSTLFFAFGELLYLLWATLANAALVRPANPPVLSI